MKKADIIKKAMEETGMQFENTTPERYAKTHTKVECEAFAESCRSYVAMVKGKR